MIVSEVLKLPSMTGAEVVAGQFGLSNPVESVTVLEYGFNNDLLEQFFKGTRFEGNEIIITAMAAISHDVEAQCENIRKYHSVGSVGIILYYVGIVIPEIHQRVIDLCNELDFVLICMPKGCIGQRYSEAIWEILHAIFEERQRKHFFVSTILERLSALPPSQRTMETLLSMLSEHLRATMILSEPQKDSSTIIYRPRAIEAMLQDKIPDWLKKIEDRNEMEVPSANGAVGHLQRCPNLVTDVGGSKLYVLSYNEQIPKDLLWQASESVRLFIHIWDKKHGQFVISELVRAIITDEPGQKDRLAEMFHVDTESLDQMWLFIPKNEKEEHDEQLLRYCTEQLSLHSSPVLVSYYEDALVAFDHAGPHEPFDFDDPIQADIQRKYAVICCSNLNSSSDARKAYLGSMENWKIAAQIFPNVKVLNKVHLIFAEHCKRVCADPAAYQWHREMIDRIRGVNEELRVTLETYLLDYGSNMAETAKALFIHINTVKYRLNQIQSITGFSPSQMPDAYSLYTAAALNRMAQ